jgi:hypothetical protein
MGVRVHNGQMPPLGALLRELAEGSASLIRQEIRLVRSRGMALLSPKGLAPAETVATLEEDTAWLKQRLTSGAISSW